MGEKLLHCNYGNKDAPFFSFFSCSLVDIQLWDVENLKGLNQFSTKKKTPNYFLLKF